MSRPAYYYSQRMGHILLQAMQEVIGGTGMQHVLETASLASLAQETPAEKGDGFPFDSIGQLHVALEKVYGHPGGQGLALRIGRACFTYGLHEYGPMLGLTEIAFRLMPLHTKMHMGANSLAGLFNEHSDQRVRIEEESERILWHIERCPLCWGRHTEQPACHMAVGLLQESLYWLSGGKIFNVEETQCVARGDAACTVVIDRAPIS